jgi:hypothetical protein
MNVSKGKKVLHKHPTVSVLTLYPVGHNLVDRELPYESRYETVSFSGLYANKFHKQTHDEFLVYYSEKLNCKLIN